MPLKSFIKSRDSLLFIWKGDSVADAVEKMIRDLAGAALVVSDTHHVVGIFTERDVLTRIVGPNLDLKTTLIEDVMTKEVITIEEEASLDAAIHCIQSNQISHLPVVQNEGQVVGMITIRHLLHEKIKDLVTELHNVEAYWNDAPGG